MSEVANKDDLQGLRDRIAELEAARDKPIKVEIEGLEGLKQWSHAVETQQLDRFVLTNSVPDGFWLYFGKMAAFVIGAFLVLAFVFDK